MKRVTVFFLLLVLTGDLFANFAYITDYVGDKVSILDLSTNKITGYVNNENFDLAHPVDIQFNPSGSLCYVVADTANAVYVIDPSLSEVVGPVNTNGFPFSTPSYFDITPDGAICYVPNATGNNVSIIDAATNMVIGYVDPNGFPFNRPTAVAFSPDGTKAYVVNNGGNNVSIVNVAANQVSGYINAGVFPFSLPIYVAFIDNTKAYVTNPGNNQVSVIDVGGDTVTGYVMTGAFPFTFPLRLFTTLGPSPTTAVVGDFESNQVSIIDIPTDTVIEYAGGKFNQTVEFHITFDNKLAYAANLGNNTISIIDLASKTVIGQVDDSAFPLIGPFAFDISNIAVISPGPQNPFQLQGSTTKNEFASQTDLVNVITWNPPSSLSINTPAQYRIYRDEALTQLIGTVNADQPLLFEDHNRKKKSVSSYFVVSVDSMGRVSAPATITITQ